MQVYDRVVPTNATSTLLVLTIGVLLAAAFDAVAKLLRSKTTNELSDRIDQRLARSVYARFLGIRLDALPRSVGALAQRIARFMKISELDIDRNVKFSSRYTACLFLLLVFAAIGGKLALIPLFFLAFGAAAAWRQHDVLSNWA